jgi:DNA-binding NarL/FixJ family response regulator
MRKSHLPITPTEEFLIRMFYLEGWSMKKISEKLNITLSEALVTRNNALRRLRRMERSELEDYLLHGAIAQNEISWDRPNQFEEVMLKLAQDIEDENE